MRRTLSGCDVPALHENLTAFVRKAIRNKAFCDGTIGGLVAAVDGTELCASTAKQCAQCLHWTHDGGHAAVPHFGNRIMVLYGGRVMELAQSDELIRHPTAVRWQVGCAVRRNRPWRVWGWVMRRPVTTCPEQRLIPGKWPISGSRCLTKWSGLNCWMLHVGLCNGFPPVAGRLPASVLGRLVDTKVLRSSLG